HEPATMTITITTTATPTQMYIFFLPFFSPPRPRPATSYDMSDLDRRSCGLVIRISSSGRRRADVQQKALHAGGRSQLNRICNLLFGKCDIRGTHVHGDPIAFVLRPQDLIPRNRDHLPPFLVLEELADGTRHRAQLHAG